MVKVSDFIIDFFVKSGIDTCFSISGGAILHLCDSAMRNPGMNQIFAQHEQHAGAMADGWARISGKPGLCMVTSGPGATNLLTSVCNAWFDSIPVVFITGQVATNRINTDPHKRQNGFQETNVAHIFKSVTKFAYRLKKAEDIQKMLVDAVSAATGGRPGPVLLDIPDDLARALIDV